MNSRSVFPEFDIRERKSPKFRDTLPLEGSKKIYAKKNIFFHRFLCAWVFVYNFAGRTPRART